MARNDTRFDIDPLDAMAAWGERLLRDQAHLMDLLIAGTMDALGVTGEVKLDPARLHQLAASGRIVRVPGEEPGKWAVRLLPETDPDQAHLFDGASD
jgi:hypothetical protein